MLRRPLLSREEKIKAEQKYLHLPSAPLLEVNAFYDQDDYLVSKQRLKNKKKTSADENSVSNLQDFIDTEKQYKKHKKSVYNRILDPEDTLLLFWQLLNLICILYYFAELPIAITFQTSYRQRDDTGYLFQIINIPSIAIFLINMLVKLKTSYYERGILISDPKAIALNYLKFAFILDLISISSIIPSEVTEMKDSDQPIDNGISAATLLFYLKFYQVSQMYKGINRSLQLHRRLKAFFNLSFLSIMILLICNAYACIFYSISQKYCANHVAPGDDPICWIDAVLASGIPISAQKWYVKYTFSLYWASTTMISIGYGDITAHNINEAMFIIVAEFTSCFVFAYSLNQIWAISIQVSEKKDKYQKKVNIINRYMRDKNITGSTRSKVNAYLAHFYRHEKLREIELQNQIISELAPALKEELLMDAYGFIFQDFLIFKNFSEDLFSQLVYKIKEQRYSEMQIICQPSDEAVDNILRYLFKGEVVINLKLNRKTYEMKTVQTQNLFGQYHFFTGTNPVSTVVAKSYCLAYTLSRSDWDEVIHRYYQDFQKFHQMKDNGLYLRNTKPLMIKCIFCNSQAHISEYCLFDKLKNEHITFIRSYRASENPRIVGFHRRKYKVTNPLQKKARKELITIQQMIVNRSINRESAVLPEMYASSEVPSNKSESDSERMSDMEFMMREQLSDRGRKPNKKALSMRSAPKNINIIASAPLKVDPRPEEILFSPITELIINRDPLMEDIDTKESYEYYFRSSNLENIIYEWKKSLPVYTTRLSRNLRDWIEG